MSESIKLYNYSGRGPLIVELGEECRAIEKNSFATYTPTLETLKQLESRRAQLEEMGVEVVLEGVAPALTNLTDGGTLVLGVLPEFFDINGSYGDSGLVIGHGPPPVGNSAISILSSGPVGDGSVGINAGYTPLYSVVINGSTTGDPKAENILAIGGTGGGDGAVVLMGSYAGQGSIAIGRGSTGSQNSTALGMSSYAADGALAFGGNSSASGVDAIALGRGVNTPGAGAFAGGVGAEATNPNGVAIKGIATGANGGAFGYLSSSHATDAFAFGRTQVTGQRAYVTGYQSRAHAPDSIVVAYEGASKLQHTGASCYGFRPNSRIPYGLHLGPGQGYSGNFQIRMERKLTTGSGNLPLLLPSVGDALGGVFSGQDKTAPLFQTSQDNYTVSVHFKFLYRSEPGSPTTLRGYKEGVVMLHKVGSTLEAFAPEHVVAEGYHGTPLTFSIVESGLGLQFQVSQHADSEVVCVLDANIQEIREGLTPSSVPALQNDW